MNPFGLKSKKHLKGLVFAGCSYTWGQGLHYYNQSPTILKPLNENSFDPSLLNATHVEYIKLYRYSTKVARFFDTYCINQPFNGGANITSLAWWGKSFLNQEDSFFGYINGSSYCIDPRDIEYFSLQITQWLRSFVTDQDTIDYFQTQGIDLKDITYDILFESYQDKLEEYLNLSGQSLDQWIEKAKTNDINQLKDMLELIEQQGVKTIVLIWPNDLVETVLKDSWLSARLVNLSYRTKTYHCIQDLADNEVGMYIANDYENFKKPPKDHHPSMKCHDVISESIIKHIQKDKNEHSTNDTL